MPSYCEGTSCALDEHLLEREQIATRVKLMLFRNTPMGRAKRAMLG